MNLFLFFLLILFSVELIYFKIAERYSIIDRPNHRSSHTEITIRGGGIIFTVALVIGALYLRLNYHYFVAGLIIISAVSFIDDIKQVAKRTRITIHLIAVALAFLQLGLYQQPFYLVILGFIVFIGTINAVNFMDGINGITGAYSLVTLLTLYYINEKIIFFTSSELLLISVIAVMVFNYFNFRKKARCFAGDVGSVGIAFIIIFFIFQLIIKTNNIVYVLLLLIYGLDTITTIAFRIRRKENIFEAHRSHFYQFLVNKKQWPHLSVALMYALLQGGINILILIFAPQAAVIIAPVAVGSLAVFVFTRYLAQGKESITGT